jgi:arylsulfatase A-like enzyme
LRVLLALATAGFALAAFLPRLAGAATADRPNVVLVITDDQGYGDLACHGNPIIKTPHLDALYRDCVRLTDFHVSPCCTPTRAALMTGRHELRSGAWGTTWGRSMPRRDEVMMAQVFADSGYRTGCFGKWHLGDNYPFRPQDRGFQEVLVHGGGGVGQTPDYWGNDYFSDSYFRNGEPEKREGYCTDVWFDAAIEFIEKNRRRPFFCYLTTNAPHGPYHVAPEYERPYADQGVPAPQAAFWGMITNIDENVARLRTRLRSLDLEENTILIFMTDNGSSAGTRGPQGFNAGMRGAKGSLFDGGHRVPCFIRWPGGGLEGGHDVDTLTAHVDLLPTLVEFCRLKEPGGFPLDGRSLAPLLRGETVRWPDRALFVQYRQSADPPTMWRGAVMTQQWRLIGGRRLYDIQADPGQRDDVAAEHPKVVARLRKAYQAWWEGASKRFDEYCRIVLGSEQENPARLTAFDWHTRTPWNQGHIRAGMAANGFWAVDVARAGEYEFALRRWPPEIDVPITAAVDGGKAIDATRARLTIADVDETKTIPAEATEVRFRVKLNAGPAKLQTWLVDGDSGDSRGAYYVLVSRLAD